MELGRFVSAAGTVLAALNLRVNSVTEYNKRIREVVLLTQCFVCTQKKLGFFNKPGGRNKSSEKYSERW
jgi:hypothetical protein